MRTWLSTKRSSTRFRIVLCNGCSLLRLAVPEMILLSWPWAGIFAAYNDLLRRIHYGKKGVAVPCYHKVPEAPSAYKSDESCDQEMENSFWYMYFWILPLWVFSSSQDIEVRILWIFTLVLPCAVSSLASSAWSPSGPSPRRRAPNNDCGEWRRECLSEGFALA